MLYRPSKCPKRCSKSFSLHSKKKFLLGGCRFFVIDVISEGLLGHLGPLCLALGANREVVVLSSILLKFLLDSRLQSKSLDTLDDLLGFQVQKL